MEDKQSPSRSSSSVNLLNDINFTWGEQSSSLPIEYSSEYPLPKWLQDMKPIYGPTSNVSSTLSGNLPSENIDSSKETLIPTSTQSEVHHLYPHVWLVHNVLSPEWCDAWIQAVAALGGYETHDVMTKIGELVSQQVTEHPMIWPPSTNFRTNQRKIWQVPRWCADMIDSRLAGISDLDEVHLDNDGQSLSTGKDNTLCTEKIQVWKRTQLNRRFRFYRADPGELFKDHKDSSSARLPDERSFYTVLLFLNDDYKGGEVKLYMTADKEECCIVGPRKGSVLIFPQDGHHDALLHTGLPVKSGTKYLLRSDLFFKPHPISNLNSLTL
jgi:hypothetical protein